jgi:hypothetical protein
MPSCEIIELCRHTLIDGHRCRGAALRGQPFCRFHQPRALVTHPQPLPPDLTDPATTRALLSEILQRIAAGKISNRRAGQLLNVLNMAVTRQNSKPLRGDGTPSRGPVRKSSHE